MCKLNYSYEEQEDNPSPWTNILTSFLIVLAVGLCSFLFKGCSHSLQATTAAPSQISISSVYIQAATQSNFPVQSCASASQPANPYLQKPALTGSQASSSGQPEQIPAKPALIP